MRSVGVLSCGAGGSVVGVACGESWWGAGGLEPCEGLVPGFGLVQR